MEGYDTLLLLNAVSVKEPSLLRQLRGKFQKDLSSLSPREILRVLEKKGKIDRKSWREYFDLEKEKKALEKEKIRVIPFHSEEFPALLKEISSPPVLLYVKGEFPPHPWKSIAIVGARNPSPYGRFTAERLSRDLSSRGITIVSGMARGIDTHAHRSALKAGGKTIAVLGSGLLHPYPVENKPLMDEISASGAAVSEYPLFTPPWRYNFPRRNRIISGLSAGVVVVEARRRSGALITAALSLEQGREIFAVPGKIDSPLSEGTNQLIQEGAKLVRNWEDVWSEFTHVWGSGKGKNQVDANPVVKLSPEAGKILQLMSDTPLHLDEISRLAEISSHRIYTYIMELAFKEKIKELPGKKFYLKI
ncbi:MAG: DNA-protecting protein DprA [Caldiserica bacterium]|nr:DNA-protecting protein DprA [Caldisericota bacterium]